MKPIRKDPKDFLQITRGYLRDMRELARRNHVAHQVLWLLAERMNRTNAVVMSQKTMGQILGYSRATLSRAIALLKEENWVQVVLTGTSNAYVLNSKVLWRDHGGKRYASFFAEVVVSEDEQSQPIEDWDNIELRNVPILEAGEVPITDDEDLPPPDQKDLIPPAPEELPTAVEGEDSIRRKQLEKRGQKHIPTTSNPDTETKV